MYDILVLVIVVVITAVLVVVSISSCFTIFGNKKRVVDVVVIGGSIIWNSYCVGGYKEFL